MSLNRAADPHRFEASRGTLRVDRWMTFFIKAGGAMVILAVFGIFAFILLQILPLFRGASVHPIKTVAFPADEYVALGADEWSELPFAVSRNGQLRLHDLAGDRGLIEDPQPVQGPGAELTALVYLPQRRTFAVGTGDGSVMLSPLKYTAVLDAGKRRVTHSLVRGTPIRMGPEITPVRLLAAGESEQAKLVAAVQQIDGRPTLRVAQLARKRTLMGEGTLEVKKIHDLTDQISAEPQQLLVASTADALLLVQADGEVDYFFLEGDRFVLRQKFAPFSDLADPRVGSAGFLLGDVSVVFSHASGASRLFSLYVHPDGQVRTFGQTRNFQTLGSKPIFLSQGLRNKAFLAGAGQEVSLRYGTTGNVRWEKRLPFETRLGVIGGKYESLFLLDQEAKLHVFALEDRHPETSFMALFGKVWYEGGDRPEYRWQSTGGSDEFEPKLSLVPLIFGTLKGTLYAMLFAVPIALFAALYTSQFLHPSHRVFVKPTMEIMASLPSVVLGFLAALWLAPILEDRIPSLLAVTVSLPIAAFLFGRVWSGLPIRCRLWVRPGLEYLAFLPLLLLVGWAAWSSGHWIEQAVFAVTDPTSGVRSGDFRRWWPAVTGTPFEQRNSVVVGFMMGFAVIPIVFTIAEDALSNVPATLRSGSLALGASRWQTAIRVVLPTASPGIFSGLMVGLGRAVGETMIVVMATGNTPILSLNPFSGMRTLSANTAVELPEAPQGGTLYRTLFLGAMVLFLMTFVVNTFAEVLRQHLRERYRTV